MTHPAISWLDILAKDNEASGTKYRNQHAKALDGLHFDYTQFSVDGKMPMYVGLVAKTLQAHQTIESLVGSMTPAPASLRAISDEYTPLQSLSMGGQNYLLAKNGTYKAIFQQMK